MRAPTFLTLFALIATTAVVHADPVAVLAALKGKVTVAAAHTRGKTPARATFGTALESGDRVSVGPGSSATLFFNDGNMVELGAGSSMTIGGRVAAGSEARAEKLPREAFASVASFRLAGSRESGLVAAPAMRGTDDAGAPEPLSPRNTDILEGRPRFAWRAAPRATRYMLTLSGTGGELWTSECAAPSLAWPKDAAPLTEGEYIWDVQAYDASGPLAKATATFRLVPELQASGVRSVVERIQQNAGGMHDPAARYLAGAFLFQHGFLADAAEQFTALAELEPTSPAPHEAMGDIYRSVGLPDLAAAALEKARILTQAR